MTCDEGRPCQRWLVFTSHTPAQADAGGSIKREIGHLCHDERRTKSNDKQHANIGSVEMSRGFAPGLSCDSTL
jgi:hypothetical protein